jgi:hypothetical protein
MSIEFEKHSGWRRKLMSICEKSSKANNCTYEWHISLPDLVHLSSTRM